MPIRALLLVMLLFPLAANAAHDELEVFDFRLCVNWSISTDVSQRQGASYTRIKALRDQRSDGADWGSTRQRPRTARPRPARINTAFVAGFSPTKMSIDRLHLLA